jgi:hypothetical protein
VTCSQRKLSVAKREKHDVYRRSPRRDKTPINFLPSSARKKAETTRELAGDFREQPPFFSFFLLLDAECRKRWCLGIDAREESTKNSSLSGSTIRRTSGLDQSLCANRALIDRSSSYTNIAGQISLELARPTGDPKIR